MIIKTLKHHWTEAEIIAEVERRTGKTPVVILDGLDITLEFGESLLENENRDVTAFFSADHDMPTVDERTAASALRESVKTIAQSTVGVTLNDLTVLQIKSLVAVLLWQAGGISSDMTINPLKDWVA